MSFTVACHQGTGGQTANKDIDWHDSAYKCFAETQELFNNDQHDSLLTVAPKVLDFLREHHEWLYYYTLWQNVAEDHAWYNEFAEATREAEAMQEDAIERKDTFGLALGYLTQGITYQMQENYDEAQKGYRKAVSLYPKDAKKGQLVSIYSYYAESLEATKDYAELDSLLCTWRSLLDNLSPATCPEDSAAYAHWYYLYFSRKIAFHIKNKHLTEAATAIDSLVYYAQATGITDNHRFFIASARHELAMAQGNYTEALNYAEEMVKLSPGSIGSRVLALESRAEALEELGKYREALADMQAYTALNDSTTQVNNREQLNRGVVAIRSGRQVVVSWRTLTSDAVGEAFDVYRNGRKLNTEPMRQGGTFFVDEAPLTADATYEVRGGGKNGCYQLLADAPDGYLPIKLQKPADGVTPDGRTFGYTANDASVGDVDGDLLRELLDHETVSKYDWQNHTIADVTKFEGVVFNNWTKSNPCLSADILGDWREEVMARTPDSSELRIYVSPIPTAHRINCLMEDIPYRLSTAAQNVGYNQPSEPGFYLGPDETVQPFLK